jgi:hypothetical protein
MPPTPITWQLADFVATSLADTLHIMPMTSPT